VKQVDLYIPRENVPEVTGILRKHEVAGISMAEVRGKGKTPQEAVPEMVRMYWYGKKVTPEYITKVHLTTVVPDSKVKPIIDDVLRLKPMRGTVFVRDILEAYDLLSKAVGETAIR
jgi:nitrogen regulatory protein PII